jgi:hypothetical protein
VSAQRVPDALDGRAQPSPGLGDDPGDPLDMIQWRNCGFDLAGLLCFGLGAAHDPFDSLIWSNAGIKGGLAGFHFW